MKLVVIDEFPFQWKVGPDNLLKSFPSWDVPWFYEWCASISLQPKPYFNITVPGFCSICGFCSFSLSGSKYCSLMIKSNWPKLTKLKKNPKHMANILFLYIYVFHICSVVEEIHILLCCMKPKQKQCKSIFSTCHTVRTTLSSRWRLTYRSSCIEFRSTFKWVNIA